VRVCVCACACVCVCACVRACVCTCETLCTRIHKRRTIGAMAHMGRGDDRMISSFSWCPKSCSARAGRGVQTHRCWGSSQRFGASLPVNSTCPWPRDGAHASQSQTRLCGAAGGGKPVRACCMCLSACIHLATNSQSLDVDSVWSTGQDKWATGKLTLARVAHSHAQANVSSTHVSDSSVHRRACPLLSSTEVARHTRTAQNPEAA
jgi:hypothetical protein